jgi:hypothetical protein
LDRRVRRDQPLGPAFGWLWAAYGVSAVGTWLAFDALPLIAILVLHAGPEAVAAIAAAGLAVAAVVAVPLGPWVEFRRKRPVMAAMDLVRFAAMGSVPVAYAFGLLTLAQLFVVAVVVGAADITFKAASGACLKAVVPPGLLLAANTRLESTAWTATALGPPLGGAAIGILGPVATVVANAVSFVLSAFGIRAMGDAEPAPVSRTTGRLRPAEVAEAWRHLLTDPQLRPVFVNCVLVNGLIMATAPLMSVLMLGRLGFPPWEYGLAFGAPCVGGLVGSRLARPLVGRWGQRRVLVVSGVLRACWTLGLVFVRPGLPGLVLVLGVQLGLVTCAGLFNPVLATWRLEQTPDERLARTLAAWSVSTSAGIATMTALWGVLAGIVGLRVAIAAAGIGLLLTPLLLVRSALTRPAAPHLVHQRNAGPVGEVDVRGSVEHDQVGTRA